MKKRVLKWYDYVLSALLSLVSYASCDPIGSAECEYGAPYVEYQLKGKVTDAESGKPIRGIQAKRVWMAGEGEKLEEHAVDSVVSNADGDFSFPIERAASYVNTDVGRGGLMLVLEDVDGNANGGTYSSDTMNVYKLEKKQVKKGDGAWFEGGYEIRADRQLKKK
ncbi:MAG: radical SAM-associated putative lipoprotein [Prevotella sp.]|nr:radical SAM-associated putative lipoprotein [Prevotella sp.]